MKSLPILLLLLFFSCRITPIKRELRQVAEISALNSNQKYLKTHMKDGTVYVLSDWSFSKLDSAVFGYGVQLDINRKPIAERKFSKTAQPAVQKFKVALPEVALIETNDPGSANSGGLTFMTGLTGTITLLWLLSNLLRF
jgi:hypothetical protein